VEKAELMMRLFLPLVWLLAVAASPATDEARRLLADRQDAAAFARTDSAARRGDPDAIALLGWFYDQGRHVPRDYARAAELYRRVVRDNPSVQWRLGVMYDLGQGVPENPTEAVRLFRQAAGENDANANASLAVMYANGRGVRADYTQAMRYYRRAAELGSGAGFLGVGLLYQYGLGVAQQPSEAAAWYLAAHALRDSRAQGLVTGLGLDAGQNQAAIARANQLLQSFRRRERVTDPR
jgi:TPR repeat protein